MVVRLHRLADIGLVDEQTVGRPIETEGSALADQHATGADLAADRAVRLADGEAVVGSAPEAAAREPESEAAPRRRRVPDRRIEGERRVGRQPVARPAEEIDHPGVAHVTEALVRHADGEFVVPAEAQQISGGQGGAEAIAGVVDSAEVGLLEPPAVDDRAERRAEELEDGAGVVVLARTADREVVVPVVVEVADGQSGAELVAGLVGSAGVALETGDDGSGAERARVPGHDPDFADVGDGAALVVPRLSDREIVLAVTVEVAGGEGESEVAVGLVRPAERLRREQNSPLVREAEGGPPVHDDRACEVESAEVFARCGGGEVIVAVTVEVPGGEGLSHRVARFLRAAALRSLADQGQVGVREWRNSGKSSGQDQHGEQQAARDEVQVLHGVSPL